LIIFSEVEVTTEKLVKYIIVSFFGVIHFFIGFDSNSSKCELEFKE
jgi:hypothetical protein